MSLRSARQGDAILHPPVPTGVIATGSPNVIVGGKPLSRAGADLVACVLPLHDAKPILTGSATVIVNRCPAARITDLAVCTAAIIQGEPTVMMGGPPTTTASVVPAVIPPVSMPSLDAAALGMALAKPDLVPPVAAAALAAGLSAAPTTPASADAAAPAASSVGPAASADIGRAVAQGGARAASAAGRSIARGNAGGTPSRARGKDASRAETGGSGTGRGVGRGRASPSRPEKKPAARKEPTAAKAAPAGPAPVAPQEAAPPDDGEKDENCHGFAARTMGWVSEKRTVLREEGEQFLARAKRIDRPDPSLCPGGKLYGAIWGKAPNNPSGPPMLLHSFVPIGGDKAIQRENPGYPVEEASIEQVVTKYKTGVGNDGVIDVEVRYYCC